MASGERPLARKAVGTRGRARVRFDHAVRRSHVGLLQRGRRARAAVFAGGLGPGKSPAELRLSLAVVQSAFYADGMSAMELRPGLADVPAAESAISFIDGQR